MAKHLTEAETEDLEENFVDRASMYGVLTSLEEICFLKAHHIQENWNDRGLAAAWKRLGTAISKVATKAKNEEL